MIRSYGPINKKFICLEKELRQDITYVVYKLAKFCENPKMKYPEALLHPYMYLYDTCTKGITLKTDPSHSLETWTPVLVNIGIL